MTASELRKAEARYQRASRRADEARADRDREIRRMIQAGHTHAEIHGILKGAITRARIGQIALNDR